MLNYKEEIERCPYCNKNVKFCVANTPACKRTYCPSCLFDIEVIWKESR